MHRGGSEHWHVWVFRLMSAIGWMFRITSVVLFGCFVLFLIFPLRVAVKCSVKACWRCLSWVREVILCRHRSGWVDLWKDGLWYEESWEGILPKGRGQCIAKNRPSVSGFDHQTGAVKGMSDSSGFTGKALSEVFLKVLSFSLLFLSIFSRAGYCDGILFIRWALQV